MTWLRCYTPPNLSYCCGRSDLPEDVCFFQIIKPLDLTQPLPTITNTAFCLIGFKCDEGIRRNHGRTGAINGPAAIREMIAKLPIQRRDIQCFDAGDIDCLNGDLEEAQLALGEAVALLLKSNIVPIILGGGHELAFGHYQGIAKASLDDDLAIVNFDAHFDMRPTLSQAQGSSGTPFLQIANAYQETHKSFSYHCIGIQPSGNILPLFETAKQWDVNVLLADDLQQGHDVKCLDFVNDILDRHERLYISLCLDVFAAPYAPGVSAPQPLGLLPWQLLPLLKLASRSGKVLSYDIAEMSPGYDIDQRTAKLAAHLVYTIVHSHGVDHAS